MSTLAPSSPGGSHDDDSDRNLPGLAAALVTAGMVILLLTGLAIFALHVRRRDRQLAEEPFDFTDTLGRLHATRRIQLRPRRWGDREASNRGGGGGRGRRSVTPPGDAALRSGTGATVRGRGSGSGLGKLPTALYPRELPRQTVKLDPAPGGDGVGVQGLRYASGTLVRPTQGWVRLGGTLSARRDDTVSAPGVGADHGSDVDDAVFGGGGDGGAVVGNHDVNSNDAATRVRVSVLRLEADRTLQDASEFVDEAVLGWQLSHHPNVQRTLGVVTVGSPRLLLREYCPHGDLRTFLRAGCRGDGPEDGLHGWRVAMLCGIADGMAYLAEQGAVHRGLCCRNVLVDAHFMPKLTAFGSTAPALAVAAVRQAGSDDNAQDPRILEPLRWIDPDVIEVAWFSAVSDIWSFGVTAIELFSDGATPYAGWTVPYVLERLEADYRLACPMACPQRVYDECVRPCWSAAATRPSFYDVHEWLLAVSGNKSTEDDGLGDGNERGRALHRSVKADSGVPSVVTSSV
eukprot:m.203001 g.203001  ORF g.203001 m.203001 type:complete len:516 (+) comp22003_c0_seq1:210-1757(+)